jgi:hypothetical protein
MQFSRCAFEVKANAGIVKISSNFLTAHYSILKVVNLIVHPPVTANYPQKGQFTRRKHCLIQFELD